MVRALKLGTDIRSLGFRGVRSGWELSSNCATVRDRAPQKVAVVSPRATSGPTSLLGSTRFL
jgi:hypothetical protein